MSDCSEREKIIKYTLETGLKILGLPEQLRNLTVTLTDKTLFFWCIQREFKAWMTVGLLQLDYYNIGGDWLI